MPAVAGNDAPSDPPAPRNVSTRDCPDSRSVRVKFQAPAAASIFDGATLPFPRSAQRRLGLVLHAPPGTSGSGSGFGGASGGRLLSRLAQLDDDASSVA